MGPPASAAAVGLGHGYFGSQSRDVARCRLRRMDSPFLPQRIVIDTSVLVAAARSRKGASFAIVEQIPSNLFQPCLSVSLYVEWQQVLSRPENIPPGVSSAAVAGFLRYIASKSHLQEIYFLWRPLLKDPTDDMALELAVASQSKTIVTYNVTDFAGADRFGIDVLRPASFLTRVQGE